MNTTFDPAKLRAQRQAHGWDQTYLAHRAGVARSAISHLEAGKTANPRVDTITRLAHALDCLPRDLMRRTGTRTTPQPNRTPPTRTPPTRMLTLADVDRLTGSLPRLWRSLYDGCTRAGFTTDQAMHLVTTAISANTIPAA